MNEPSIEDRRQVLVDAGYMIPERAAVLDLPLKVKSPPNADTTSPLVRLSLLADYVRAHDAPAAVQNLVRQRVTLVEGRAHAALALLRAEAMVLNHGDRLALLEALARCG